MSKNAEIKVDGLSQLRKELRKAGGDFPKELKDANFNIVNDLIVPEARDRAEGAFPRGFGKSSVHPGQKVADSIHALRQERAAYVVLGGARVPWAAGFEFGSAQVKHTQRGGHTTQFPVWRGSGRDAGYFLWPTIREKTPEIIKRYGDLLDKLAGKAFPD